MNFLNVILSSYQISGKPNYLNHWFFEDPIYGTDFYYPNTVDGGVFVTLSGALVPQVLRIDTTIDTESNYSSISAKDTSTASTNNLRLNKTSNTGIFSLDNTINTSLSVFSVGNDINFNFDQDSFTITTIFSSGRSNLQRIVNKGHWFFSPGYVIQSDGSNVRVGLGSIVSPLSSIYHKTTNNPLVDGYNHVALVVNRTASTLICYVNSVATYLTPVSISSNILNISGTVLNYSNASQYLSASSNDKFLIGKASSLNFDPTNSESFKGNLQSIKFYDTALTQNEVQYDYYSSTFLFGSTSAYALTTYGGLFFPWGYQIQNTYETRDLGVLKGPYTFTYIPSAIDNTYYTTLKIIYDFLINTT